MTQYWEPGTQYDLGAIVLYEGHKYRIIQPHRSQSDWTPPVTPALWGRLPHNYAGEGEPTASVVEEITVTEERQPQQHWWDSEHHKKELEVGGGLLAGALALGAGYFAYKQHEKHEAQKQANIHGLEQWMKEAQARTDAYDQGSSEVAWILNRGPSIPYKAIEGGRDESGEIIYIARACVEGGIHPGKASRSFNKGGLIGFRRKTIEVETYEILVGDPNRVCWVDHSRLGQPGSPRPIVGGQEDTGKLLYIAQAEYGGGIHPGKAGGQFAGAFIAINDQEVNVETYNVLCYA